MNDISPVVLFVYNRPEHTRLTLEALKRNHLADETDLYFFCDGAPQDLVGRELDAINEVRRIVGSINWCKKIKICEEDQHLGLSKLMLKGVNSVLQNNDRIIVLNDHLVTAPGFLKFMNDALRLYQTHEEIMHVSGYMYPVGIGPISGAFFVGLATSWGWATWKRAWEVCDNFAPKTRNSSVKINKLGSMPESIKIPGSAVSFQAQWHACVLLHDGLCLHPARSFVQNIDQDGTYTVELSQGIGLPQFQSPERNTEIEDKIISFCRTGIRKKTRVLLRNLIRNFLFLRKKNRFIDEWHQYNDLLNWWGRDTVWKEIKTFLHDRSGKVLDIGCGNGEVILSLLVDEQLDVFGCDISERLIVEATKKGIDKNKLNVSSATRLDSYDDKFFDYTFSIAMAQYLSDTDLVAFLSECRRITKVKCFIFVPVSFSWANEEWNSGSWHLYRNNSPMWWKNLLTKYFFSVHIGESNWTDLPVSAGKWFICTLEG